MKHTTPHHTITKNEMAESIPKRYAMVTGANKGIGLEICRLLASKGITVICTSRNKDRGMQALQRLKQESNLSDDCLVFHQLDVVDSASIASLADFIKNEYGRLDILVNNAGLTGLAIEGDVLVLQKQLEKVIAAIFASEEDEADEVETNGKTTETLEGAEDGIQTKPDQEKINGRITQSLEDAEECINTNFYGVKRVTEALLPLLQLSNSPRIVNVTSSMGNIKLLRNKWAKQVLRDEEYLTEEKVDQVVGEFLKNFKEGTLRINQWPTEIAAYKVSKASMNAYTRIMAKKYPTFSINCVCPGFARTDFTHNLGSISAAEAAEGPVALALAPDGGPSGSFFYMHQMMPF
ncbi:(+)-neomenthol dehydrogenase-like [Andrographis paniculata]|uniref:(+)-neomenthol dehydrogenase-like n=1 Tax=Andrographis paniculata TaxID=175694 RepID=UPI0021E859E0|nr:(+)-neomenthol dehydrogenase-like [Andrographis paniculata]